MIKLKKGKNDKSTEKKHGKNELIVEGTGGRTWCYLKEDHKDVFKLLIVGVCLNMDNKFKEQLKQNQSFLPAITMIPRTSLIITDELFPRK